MKNPIDTAMLIESFDFLTKEHGFIRKGTLYIRLVDNLIIQTVYPFKTDSFSIDMNIGIYSIYEAIYPGAFKDGRKRLSNFEDAIYILFDPEKTLLRVRQDFVKHAIPFLDDVTTTEKLVDFVTEKYDRTAIFLAYIKLGDMKKAYKALEDEEKFELEGLEIIKSCENIYPKDSIMEQNELIELIRTRKRAVENEDMDYLNAILETNYLNSKKMLQPYGILLN